MKAKNSKELWEQQYDSGVWDYLSCDSEYEHYSMVAAYVQKAKQPYSLLDLGCGEGILLKYLDREALSQYTGVDIAQGALDRIRDRRANDEYVCCALERYASDRLWDVILFNEVLYFTADPIGLLKKYSEFLAPNGMVVVSMHQKKNPFCLNNRCLRKVLKYLSDAKCEVIDRVQINNGARWDILVYRTPKSPDQEPMAFRSFRS